MVRERELGATHLSRYWNHYRFHNTFPEQLQGCLVAFVAGITDLLQSRRYDEAPSKGAESIVTLSIR